MRKIRSALALTLILLFSVPAFAGTIKLSSTIGPVDAGIVPLLAETYKAKTGTDFVIEKAGTGATLNKAKQMAMPLRRPNLSARRPIMGAATASTRMPTATTAPAMVYEPRRWLSMTMTPTPNIAVPMRAKNPPRRNGQAFGVDRTGR